MPEIRNMLVDTGKGIAIILMCIGHAYCPDALFRFIYMFHMAFFFMMSGYFFPIRILLIRRLLSGKESQVYGCLS